MWGDSSFVDVDTMDKSHKTACNVMIDYACNLLRVIDDRGFSAQSDPMPTFLSCGDLDIFSIFSCSFVEDASPNFFREVIEPTGILPAKSIVGIPCCSPLGAWDQCVVSDQGLNLVMQMMMDIDSSVGIKCLKFICYYRSRFVVCNHSSTLKPP